MDLLLVLLWLVQRPARLSTSQDNLLFDGTNGHRSPHRLYRPAADSVRRLFRDRSGNVSAIDCIVIAQSGSECNPLQHCKWASNRQLVTPLCSKLRDINWIAGNKSLWPAHRRKLLPSPVAAVLPTAARFYSFFKRYPPGKVLSTHGLSASTRLIFLSIEHEPVWIVYDLQW